MSHQLSNTSTFNTPFPIPEFTPSQDAVIVNSLFFASLALIISTAFLAILVKGWLREFDRGMQSITVPQLRAKERECRLLGLERWHVPEIMALLPILLQASLALFCVGLIFFLRGINSLCATVFLAIFAMMTLLYVLTNISALFDHFSPFSSPISRALRDWLQIIGWELPKVLATWVESLKNVINDTDNHRGYWLSAGIALAMFPFGVMIHLILIITRAVPWYPRSKILKRKRVYEHSQTVRATVPSLNRLERVTVKAPENTEIFLSIFDEALIPSIQIWPSSRWSDILECLFVGESDLSLRRTRTLLCVLAFVPKSWEVPILTLPLTPVILGKLDENSSHPLDIPLYYLLQTLLRGVNPINYFRLISCDDALLEWHWNQMCIAISNLGVYDDESLWFLTDLAKLAGRHDLPTRVTDRYPQLLLAITTYLQTAMSNKNLEKSKFKTLIAATLQSFCITARFNIPPFPPVKLLPEGSDIFGVSQEPRLETIDFRALQQAWLSAPDEELHNTMALYILPMNTIICSCKVFYSDVDNLRPLINQRPDTPTFYVGVVQRLIQVGLDEYDHRLLLEKYDTWIAEDTERIELDGLKVLNDEVLAKYEARSPWLRLYIDTRLTRPTTLQSNGIESMRWHNKPGFDSIATIRIRDYENGTLTPEPALLELFSHSLSLETHFRLFSFLEASDTSVDPELARIAPLLTEQLVSHLERVIGTTFHELFQKWTFGQLEAYFFLMETIHPQWGTLSQEWRSAFAREFLAKGSVTYVEEVSELLETYFERDVQYGVSTSRTKQPLPQEITRAVTVEPMTPMEKGGESQKDTFQDIIQGYHEKWEVIASTYLPFLADVMQEAPEYMTKDVVARIKARLLRLPDYFGDELTRSKLFHVLGRTEGMIDNAELFQQAWAGSEVIGVGVHQGGSFTEFVDLPSSPSGLSF